MSGSFVQSPAYQCGRCAKPNEWRMSLGSFSIMAAQDFAARSAMQVEIYAVTCGDGYKPAVQSCGLYLTLIAHRP